MKLLKRILIWTGIGLCRIWVIPFALSLLVLFPGSHAQENDGAGTTTSGYPQKKKAKPDRCNRALNHEEKSSEYNDP